MDYESNMQGFKLLHHHHISKNFIINAIQQQHLHIELFNQEDCEADDIIVIIIHVVLIMAIITENIMVFCCLSNRKWSQSIDYICYNVFRRVLYLTFPCWEKKQFCPRIFADNK